MIDPVPCIVNGDNVGPVDATKVPRYAGQANFAKLPLDRRDRPGRRVIVGVPFDTGVTYRPGARFGPGHIRESSRLLRPYNPVLDVSPFASMQVVDAGDLAVNPFDLNEAITTIEHGARDLLERAPHLLTLGGDHTIALPLLRAFSAIHGPIAVVHFDAHLDTWDTYFGAAYTHGTPFRRASEEGLLDKGSLRPRRHQGPAVHHRRSRPGRRTGLRRHLRPPRPMPSALPGSPSASPPGSATAPCTSRSTSTCSTRRTPPAPEPPRPAA